MRRARALNVRDRRLACPPTRRGAECGGCSLLSSTSTTQSSKSGVPGRSSSRSIKHLHDAIRALYTRATPAGVGRPSCVQVRSLIACHLSHDHGDQERHEQGVDGEKYNLIEL